MVSMIDFHTHLDLINDNLGSVIDRAKTAGVEGFIVPGVCGFPQKIDIIKKYKEIKVCWGIFPKYAEEEGIFETAKHELMESDTPVFAIGECGLDKRFGNLEKQTELFQKQIDLAVELQLPLVIHLVGYYGRAYEILYGAGIKNGFILHSWTGSAQMAKEFVKIGGKISLSAGILRNPKKIRELFEAVPEESILYETDSPDQKPGFWQGDFNEPAVLPEIIKRISANRK